MVNVAHRSQRARDAGGPQHGQLAPLLGRERRAPAPGNPIRGHVSGIDASAAHQRRAEHGLSGDDVSY